jgi:hypothetical protein
MRGVRDGSKEYESELDGVIDIIREVAQKYLNEKYDIWVCLNAYTENQGLPIEYDALYMDVYVVDKDKGGCCSDTKGQEYVGGVEYARSGYGFGGGLYAGTYPVDPDPERMTVYFYTKKEIRRNVRELFEEWARTIEEGKEELLNPKVVRRLSKLREVEA